MAHPAANCRVEALRAVCHLPLDRPRSPEDLPDLDTVEAARGRTAAIVGLVQRARPTLRQLRAYLPGACGLFMTPGTPEQIADLMEDLARDGATDGFNLMPSILPAMPAVFIADVIPSPRKRDLFRSNDAGRTLRDHNGFDQPNLRA